MTPEQVSTLRDKLIAACDAHIAQGGKIVDRYFCRGEGAEACYCPVYALAGIKGGVEEALSAAVGFPVSSDAAWSFLNSFDNVSLHWLQIQGRAVPEMVKLGNELRAKYITQEPQP